ncbi:MAG: hypothetical protein AB8G22_02880, partial [Saprospiraceae bacterium]
MKNSFFSKKYQSMALAKLNIKTLGIALCALLLFLTSTNSFGQNDIVIRNFMNSQADLDALDAAFDNVIGVTSNPN